MATVPHNLPLLVGGDFIRSATGDNLLKQYNELAQATNRELSAVLESAEDAIRELIDPQPLAPGTDLNDVRETGRYFVRLTVDAATITNRPEGIGDGPFILDVVTTPFNQTTQSYSGYSGAAAGFFTRQTGNAAGTAFTPWADGGGSGGVGGSVNALRVLDFTTRRPVINTGNKGAVALRFDHGLTKFKSSILPLLRTNNLKSSLALNSRTWTRSENSGATKADVISWVAADGVEVWNHGASHTDAASTIALTEQIVTGLAELRADLPGVTIDGFVVPGVGGTNYDGFNGGATIGAFSTTAGQLILENHAVSTGAFPGTSQRVLDGRVRQGQGHYSIEAQTVTAIKAQIDLAVTNKTGLQLMMHPSVLDTAGNLTTAQLGEVLAYIRNRVTAGVLVALSPYEMMVADSRVDATAVAIEAAKWQRPALPSTADLNNVVTPGWHPARFSAILNKPGVAGVGTGDVLVFADGATITHLWLSNASVPVLSMRRRSGGTWTPWVKTTDELTSPPTLGTTIPLNDVLTPGRWKTVTASVAGNPALNYPPGAVHGLLDVISLGGTGYVEQIWTDTWTNWTATRKYYGSPPAWYEWERHGEQEAEAAVAPVATRVSALENNSGFGKIPIQEQRTVHVTSDYRPDAWAAADGVVNYWTGPRGTERIGWAYRGAGYVGKLSPMAGYSTMQIKKMQSNDEVEVSCLNTAAGKHVTYRVQGKGTASSQDDQRRFEEAWVGTYSGTAISKDLLIIPRSNMEWAFQINVGGNPQFAPYHGTGSVPAVQYEEATITDGDGNTINLSGMAVNEVASGVKGFKVRQRLYLSHPDTPTVRLASVDEVRTIAPDGMVQSEAVITFLRDVVVGSNYAPMTPVDQATFGNMKVLGGGTYTIKTAPPATTEYLPVTEGHATSSAYFWSNTDTTAFVAVNFLDRLESFRVGDALEDTSANAMRIEQRATGGGLTKLYPQPFAPGSTIPAGTVWRPGAQWRAGQTTNAAQHA